MSEMIAADPVGIDPDEGDVTGVVTPLDAEKKKPGPKKGTKKGPRYERPTLGRIIHVVADIEIASRLNCEVGTECAAIVTNAGDGDTCFIVHVYSPTTNPDMNRYVIWDTDGETSWHWPERV